MPKASRGIIPEPFGIKIAIKPSMDGLATVQTTSQKQSINANAARICILAFDVVGLALVEIHLVIWRFAPVRTDTLIIGLIRNNWHR